MIISAPDGEKALKIIEEKKNISLIVDIMMPKMSGFELCRIIRQSYPATELPIIFLTAKNQSYDLALGFEKGANDYITKPFSQIELIARIRLHLSLITTHIDIVTSIANRKYFELMYELEWRKAQKEKSEISIIMIDIDYFKLYNDTYGHLQGDKALKCVAKSLNTEMQHPGDLAARFGGEEFVVLLTKTDILGAQVVAQRIRKKIEDLKIIHKESSVCDYLTISLGIAHYKFGEKKNKEEQK